MVSIGNAKQVLNLFTRTAGQSFVQRPNIVSVLASDLRYTPQAEGDVFVSEIKKVASTFIKADKKLFSWAKRKPALSMTKVNPESLVMVHRTNYFPQGGKILSRSASTRNTNGISEYRPTIHFALNKSVTEHAYGASWNCMEYSIILPFKETVESMPKSKVIGGIQDDFFFIDSVKLPKGSIIIKRNSDIAKDQLKVSEIFDGVRLVETSTDDMKKTTDLIIEKMGYTPHNKALQKYLGATDKEMKLLTSFTQETFLEEPENIVSSFDVLREQKKEAICDLVKKYTKKIKNYSNTWSKFCDKQNYYNGRHQGTAWADSEWMLQGLDFLSKENKNSWLWQETNYQIKLLEKLNIIKEKLPSNKDLGYNIDELISIIKNSNNPESAQKEVLQKLKIKTLNPIDIPKIMPDFLSEDSLLKYNETRSCSCEFTLQEILKLIIHSK